MHGDCGDEQSAEGDASIPEALHAAEVNGSAERELIHNKFTLAVERADVRP